MNKLLIVGHPASGIQELETVLRRSGFRPALPSRREGMRPDEFLASARKSLDLPESRQPCSEDGFQQVQPGQAWQTLAADLLLGNENQGPWFWSSPELLPFLGFWKDQDPGFLIVMIYDDPHSALGGDLRDIRTGGDPESLRQRMVNWEAYNAAMLRFHLRNPDRSLLVHGGKALFDSDVVVRLIRERLTVEVASSAVAERGGDVSEAGEAGLPVCRMDVAARFLQDAFVSREPRAGHLYQELQASASLPAGQAAVPSLDEALADLYAHGVSVRRWAEEVKGKEDARRIWEFHLTEIQEALERNYLDLQGCRWHLREAERKLEAPHGAAERVKQQLAYRIGATIVNGTKSAGGLLLMPVVLLVETIHFFLVTRISVRNQKLPPLREYADYEAGEKVKQQLSYRIGRTVQHNLKSPVGWFRLPSAVSKEIKAFKKSRKPEVTEETKA